MLVAAEESQIARAVTVASHHHPRGQVTLALRGAFQVEARDGTWTIPAGNAVWIPPGAEHAERLDAGTALRTLWLDPALASGLANRSRTLVVAPLLREMILRVAAVSGLNPGVAEHVRLAGVLIDELRAAPDAALELAAPRDQRALRVARLVEDAPGDRCSVAELAQRAGVNRRTLERLFMAELGMTVGAWRQRLRLHHAVRLLAEDRPVAEVARDTGYGSAPAFIAVFRRHFGTTPNQYRRES